MLVKKVFFLLNAVVATDILNLIPHVCLLFIGVCVDLTAVKNNHVPRKCCGVTLLFNLFLPIFRFSY